MSGAHHHPEIAEFATLQERVDDLAARLAALEATHTEQLAEPAGQSLPFGFGAGFRLPPDLPTAVIGNPAWLQDALRDGNIEIEIPEGIRLEYYTTPVVGPNVRLWARGRGATLKAHGSNACLKLVGDNVLVQNLRTEGGEDTSHGRQVLVGPIDNYWLDHVTFTGAADDGLQLWAWPGVDDAPGDGLLTYCRFERSAGYSNTKGMIVGARDGLPAGSSARTRVTVYRSVFDVYQRGPLISDGAYVHLLECAWSGWGIHGVKTRLGGMALVESSHFRYSGGGHPEKAISGWGEPDHAVRVCNVKASGGALLREPSPHLVPDPPYGYVVEDRGYDWLLAHAGAGAQESS